MNITFPEYTNTRCLMMPYIQGDPESVPDIYDLYRGIIADVYLNKGAIGHLTIDESVAQQGKPHRGAHAKFDRALHTEAGVLSGAYRWGGYPYGWGGRPSVTLQRDTQILLANNLDNTCAVWDAVHENTSEDGDIGDFANDYPYSEASFVKAGEVHQIGILTPHESIPVASTVERQFLRIVGEGVHGRELHFTTNPLMPNLHER